MRGVRGIKVTWPRVDDEAAFRWALRLVIVVCLLYATVWAVMGDSAAAEFWGVLAVGWGLYLALRQSSQRQPPEDR